MIRPGRFPAWRVLLAALCAVLALAGTASTQDTSQKPISIAADKMEVDDQSQVITFSGSVVARQEDMVLTCDRMVVLYRKKGGGESEKAGGMTSLGAQETEIVRIDAEGNFKVTRGDQVAESQKAVYMAQAVPRTIVLTGDPRIWREKDYLTGTRIVYFVDENRSVVEGGRQGRVNAVFHQSGGMGASGDTKQ